MRLSLILHRWIGLAAAVFLALAALTGCLLVFRDEPDFWPVHSTACRLPDQQLLRRVEDDAPSAHVEAINFASDHERTFLRSDGIRVHVDPCDGSILRKTSGTDRFLATVQQLHVRLMAGTVGAWIVNVATAAVLLMIPTGLLLWWRKPQWTIRRHRSTRRMVVDLHNVSGFYAATFILILAATGALLGFERPLAMMLHVREWQAPAAPHSIEQRGGTIALDIDGLLARARSAVPDGTVTRMTLPRRRASAVRIELRGPGLFDQRTVFLDRYTGAMLRVDDLASTPLWYRLRAAALTLHTGDVFGLAGKLVAFLTGLSLAMLIITGTWMWSTRSKFFR